MKASKIGLPVFAALAALALATGCSSNDATESGTQSTSSVAATSNAQTTESGDSTTEADDATTEAPDTSESPSHGEHSHEATPGAAPGGASDVDCGPVTDPDGKPHTVVGVSTEKGRVGCTEAINVATVFVGTVSNKPTATVEGWECGPQSDDPTYPSRCEKDGLIIGLRAS
ncbi:hypothetical protein [Nocardia callitridis]|uniref:Secreted protein n=1 Tax=Nocardia callitridis TaxID=648753 RepID=A0ABP9JYE0_9NOCA